MADSHPFANTGLSQFGGDRRYGFGSADTGLGSFAAAYLAHKTGLIDYSDKTQKESVDKNGVLGHLLKGVMDKSVAPNQLSKTSAFEGIPAGNIPVPESSFAGIPAPNAPTSGSSGMDMQLSSAPQPIIPPPNQSDAETQRLLQQNAVPPTAMSQAPMDFHDFDTDISSYAGMMGVDDLSSLASFLV
jgi:hypothetical protein